MVLRLANYRFSLGSCYIVCFWRLGFHKEDLLEDIPHLRHTEVGCVTTEGTSGEALVLTPLSGMAWLACPCCYWRWLNVVAQLL